MSEATWAILKHYSSSLIKPQHECCPVGKDSWCSYQRDIATGRKTHQPTKHPFSEAIVEELTPLFSRLASVSFLENCKQCHTQNVNESFNHLLWCIAPKG